MALAACGAGTAQHPLDVLEGRWRGDAWGGQFEASYATRADGTAIGFSRLIRDGERVFYEFEVFDLRNGVLPFPSGKPADVLPLATVEREGKRLVFENPSKDYPTRIAFERAGQSLLTITLTDPHGGSPREERFELRLVGEPIAEKLAQRDTP